MKLFWIIFGFIPRLAAALVLGGFTLLFYSVNKTFSPESNAVDLKIMVNDLYDWVFEGKSLEDSIF